MEKRRLGRTQLEVGVIGLGAMPLSLEGRPDEKRGCEVIRAAVDAGMTLIDTADVYCHDDDDLGHNERLIAKALAQLGSERDRIVVATKGGLRRPGGAWKSDARPESLKEACEASLQALGVEQIDLYQLHAPDDEVPFADSVGALAGLRESGKIRHVGLSNVSVAQIEEAQSIVEIATVQNRCNLFETEAFLEGVVVHCAKNEIAFLPYSPVGGHRGHDRTPKDTTLVEIGEKHNATPYQVMLAWLAGMSHAIIPIPGASRVESARSSAAAADLTLDPDDRSRLDQLADAQ